MRMKKSSFWTALMLIVLVGTAVPLATLRAQTNQTVISLAVPSFSADVYTDKLFADFLTAHPNDKINVVKYDANIPNVTGGLTAHLAALQSYVNTADVVYIDALRTPVTEAATRAGYFLDLAPLVNQDKAINTDDFYPSLWQSFQWNKGIWALPISADGLILSYDPAAFDKAGIAYPSAKWTIDDIVAAATKLGVKNADGTVSQPGLVVSPGRNVPILMRSLLNQDLFDANAFPNAPTIDTPATEALLDTWNTQLVATGLVSTNNSDLAAAPLAISQISNFERNQSRNTALVGILLPGGKAALWPQGFAVSGGTQHQEDAYALASFLTTRPELIGRGSITPARKSLAGTQNAGGGGPGGGPGGRSQNVSPEVQKLIDDALANGISTTELRYTDYLNVALTAMKSAAKPDAKTALQTVEAQAVADLQAADAAKLNPPAALIVSTPVPTAVLTGSKIAIKFNLTSFTSPLPNQARWDSIIKDFIANDPQVGRVDMDTTPRFGTLDQTIEAYDCFYLPNNAVPTANLGLLLNLDPFFTADKSFDKSDVAGNVMDQLTRDSKIWGYPMVIQPGILQYDSAQFSKNGLPDPSTSWTITDFNNAVKALHPDSASPAPFIGTNTGGAHLLILAAAYGGLPLDYRTTPVTINFTDPANVDAIRQVLDLAKNGYIDYTAPLGGFSFRGGGGGGNNLINAIYTSNLNAFLRQFNIANANSTSTTTSYKPIPYPEGTKYSAVSYSIGVGYVTSSSQNPEACYRFLSTIAKHPDLFTGMPARYSMLNDPSVTASPATLALYQQIDTLLKKPTTISFPALTGGGGGITGFLVQHWLFGAFDKYVLDGADLVSSLKDAQDIAKGFQDCSAAIPPFDPATQTAQQYNQQIATCATKVDPTLKQVFGG